MKRYKYFLDNYFVWLQLILALAVSLSALFYMVVDAGQPISREQFQRQKYNLQLIKEDLSTITGIDKATLKVEAGQTTVLIKETDCTLKAIFDVEGNCINSEILDTRPGESIGECTLLTLMTYVFAFALTFVIKGVFYIPMLVQQLKRNTMNKEDTV